MTIEQSIASVDAMIDTIRDIRRLVNLGIQEGDQLRAINSELLEALKLAVRQNEHDMLLTGEELRVCCAAIAKAEGK